MLSATELSLQTRQVVAFGIEGLFYSVLRRPCNYLFMVSLSLRSGVISFGSCFYKVIDLFSLKVLGVHMVSLNLKKVYIL